MFTKVSSYEYTHFECGCLNKVAVNQGPELPRLCPRNLGLSGLLLDVTSENAAAGSLQQFVSLSVPYIPHSRRSTRTYLRTENRITFVIIRAT